MWGSVGFRPQLQGGLDSYIARARARSAPRRMDAGSVQGQARDVTGPGGGVGMGMGRMDPGNWMQPPDRSGPTGPPSFMQPGQFGGGGGSFQPPVLRADGAGAGSLGGVTPGPVIDKSGPQLSGADPRFQQFLTTMMDPNRMRTMNMPGMGMGPQ